ncbi:peptide deformylase [Paenisporosarcina cavernae]|uniref:Peptide deformylase n=1 Tax=Paenisporosarcina cavernae TaxID=2320858 RepID=A0A385YU56_9BACL|nr:peptide deformylase [Paenisporosarcina cavernae]AYC29102.1 peptide deformylase [Paenisporosarcina cavernae]
MILMKDIIREGHPTLREKAKEVVLPLSDEDKQLAHDLLEYVVNSQDDELAEKYDIRPGIGIAAPQINVSKRMFALHIEEEDGDVSFVAINPKIVSHSVEKTYLASGEGCLSVDREVPGYVPRYARVTVTGFYPTGEAFKMRLDGLTAIAFQHELDHLNGVMFYDRINEKDPFAEIPNAKALDRDDSEE